MTASFYSAFEDRFRGSRELIQQRLQAYLPFLQALAAQQPGGRVLDVGCGRGEWLEITRDHGFEVLGIDVDDGMLAQCTARGLPVQQGDGLAYLRTLPSGSHAMVSAFHVVEHLRFEQVQELAAEAMRVLAPGGLLLLETPNTENVVVGSSFFYIDPTHERPVHSSLLAFVVEQAGFARNRVVRLNEDPQLAHRPALGLYDVLAGASPDFAIVAQKPASPQAMASFDAAFSAGSGLSLADLAARYDALLGRRIDFAGEAGRRLQELEGRTEALAAQVAQLHSALTAIQNSRSWRWTAPVRQLHARARSRAGRVLRSGLPLARRVIARSPLARRVALGILRASPRLARLVARLSGTGQEVPAALQPQRFEDLRSVRIMQAVAALPPERASVTFLEIPEHGE